MKVPFTLRHVSPRPVEALLLLTDEPSELLAVCARLGGWPQIHAVAGGFLVRLEATVTFIPVPVPFPVPVPDLAPGSREGSRCPPMIRLRALCPDLFIPVDAELSPALLPDEASSLVRRHGLVFLSDGNALAFAPEVTLKPADLIRVARLPRRAWLPLPPRPRRPDQLTEIVLDRPPPSPEEIIASGGAGIGTESPRPGASNFAVTMAGHALAGLGSGLAWLGRQFNSQRLAQLGAALIEQGIRQVPRVSEMVLGQQEAALRELLRQFREGNLDDALRRAMPLGSGSGQSSRPATDAILPSHDIGYSLDSLLGSGGGSGGVWMTSSDVFNSLTNEYRRAAEAAARSGDHRRAAFIYGKLLGEWRPAAAVLERGGLHRDAAILYLHKLNDLPAAARAFESAGEVDQALELYLRQGDHAAAGDLLQRAGDPERALEQYQCAAEVLRTAGNELGAGELMLRRAGRSDLAESYFRDGWARRQAGAMAQGCLLHLLDLYSHRSPPTDLMHLLGEADEFFNRAGTDAQAAAFYNRLAYHSGEDHLNEWHDELRDRALLGLANRARQCAKIGHGAGVVQSLFTLTGTWESALVRDAEVAVRGARQSRKRTPIQKVWSMAGQVTAVCAARTTGDVFIGFASGTILQFDPVRGCVPLEPGCDGRVDALSVDDQATLLVAVSHGEDGHALYRWALSETHVDSRRGGVDYFAGPPCLTPVLNTNGRHVVGLYDGESLCYLTGRDLVSEMSVPMPADFQAALILTSTQGERRRTMSLVFESNRMSLQATAWQDGTVAARLTEDRLTLRLPWTLDGVGEVNVMPVSWSRIINSTMEIVAITAGGSLGWARMSLFVPDPVLLGAQQVGNDPPFLAATLIPSAETGVVGVTANGVRRYRVSDSRLVALPVIEGDLREALFCSYCPPSRELVIVTRRDVLRMSLVD